MVDRLNDRIAGQFLFPVMSQVTSAWRKVHGTKWPLIKVSLAMALSLFLLSGVLMVVLMLLALIFLTVKASLFKLGYLDQHSLIVTIFSYGIHLLKDLFFKGILAVLSVGHLIFVLKTMQGERPAAFSIFDPFSQFWRILITSAVSILIMFGVTALVAVVFLQLPVLLTMLVSSEAILKLITAVSYFLAFALPGLLGLYLLATLHYAPMLAYEHDLSPWQAITTCYKISRCCWFRFIIILVMGLLLSALLSVTIVGLLWAIPFMSLLHGVMYQHLFGQQ